MIITIACEKGGVGKSSLAQTLAVYLQQKNKDVLIVDADPQRTTAEWAEERNEGGRYPKIPCTELSGNMVDQLQEFNKRYGYIVVDCGGTDSKALRSSLAVANLAIVPFRPKRRDLKRAPEMAELIEQIQAHNTELKIRSVLTQCPTLPSQIKRILTAKEFLFELNLAPIDNFSASRNAWDDAEEDGASVLETKEDPKAAAEATAIFDEILGVI